MSHLMCARGGVALLAVLLLAGCGGSSGLDTAAGSSDSPSSAPATSSSAPPSTESTDPSMAPTATVDPAAEAVAADWRRYRSGFVKGLRSRNARVPDLVRYATAKKQADDRDRIRTMRARDYVFKGTPQIWIKDISTDGHRARLRACEFDSASRYVDANTGATVVAVKDKWESRVDRLIMRGGRWQVDSVTFVKFSCKGAKKQ
jgi:hypothetical protein